MLVLPISSTRIANEGHPPHSKTVRARVVPLTSIHTPRAVLAVFCYLCAMVSCGHTIIIALNALLAGFIMGWIVRSALSYMEAKKHGEDE